jgi:sulfur-oxidizing protein SoxB
MLSRRDFLQVTAATAAMLGAGVNISRAATGQKISQEEILKFKPVGQVTLLNFTDIHAQLVPIYFREPSVNIGVGNARGLPPHITGNAFLKKFGIKPGTPEAYAFTCTDFVHLAREYGHLGGLAQMATLIKAVRAERPTNTILIDNGDTWQGSLTSLKTRGEDMVGVMNLLGVDLMTAHWEFTYGEERVKELISKLKFPFLAGNVRDAEFEEPVFKSQTYFERNGVKVAVIGQAFPYTPIANPRYMMADWTFGIQEDLLRDHIKKAKVDGADLIVLASHNGFDVDRKLASRVDGIDVILTGHTHDAIPAIIRVKDTLLVAAGSHGKFLARLDIEVKNKKIANHNFKMMPVFSDAIKPDPEIAAAVKKIRAPYEKELGTVLGTTDGLLYRRGNFNGTVDDLICNAIMQERDSEIAFSPGFRWGCSLLPGTDITTEYIYNQTAITYGEVTRSKFTGAFIKVIIEDVGDNLFNKDPYLQQGGDMVRVGGMGFTFDISKPMGQRVSNMTLLSTGDPIDPKKTYIVGGWASVRKGAKGPQIFDLVSDYIRKTKAVHVKPNKFIKVLGA